MHKTKTGRWQPDKPPEPEPELRMAPRTYDTYVIHRYSHMLDHDDCPWCLERLQPQDLGANPFAILSGLTLR